MDKRKKVGDGKGPDWKSTGDARDKRAQWYDFGGVGYCYWGEGKTSLILRPELED